MEMGHNPIALAAGGAERAAKRTRSTRPAPVRSEASGLAREARERRRVLAEIAAMLRSNPFLGVEL